MIGFTKVYSYGMKNKHGAFWHKEKLTKGPLLLHRQSASWPDLAITFSFVAPKTFLLNLRSHLGSLGV